MRLNLPSLKRGRSVNIGPTALQISDAELRPLSAHRRAVGDLPPPQRRPGPRGRRRDCQSRGSQPGESIVPSAFGAPTRTRRPHSVPAADGRLRVLSVLRRGPPLWRPRRPGRAAGRHDRPSRGWPGESIVPSAFGERPRSVSFRQSSVNEKAADGSGNGATDGWHMKAGTCRGDADTAFHVCSFSQMR